METREILLAFQRGELSLKQAQASLQGFSDLALPRLIPPANKETVTLRLFTVKVRARNKFVKLWRL